MNHFTESFLARFLNGKGKRLMFLELWQMVSATNVSQLNRRGKLGTWEKG